MWKLMKLVFRGGSIMKKQTDMELWAIEHKKNIEEEFGTSITDKRLSLFCCYNTLDDMEKEFYDLADSSKSYVKKVLDKWVIRLA